MSTDDDEIVTMQDLQPHERLRLLRERAAIRQAEFAALLGVTQSTVSHWESGSTKPAQILRGKIAEILGLDPYHCINCSR